MQSQKGNHIIIYGSTHCKMFTPIQSPTYSHIIYNYIHVIFLYFIAHYIYIQIKRKFVALSYVHMKINTQYHS